MTYLYRGLMFGDGDGLDRMGLMLGATDEDNKVALVLFMAGVLRKMNRTARTEKPACRL